LFVYARVSNERQSCKRHLEGARSKENKSRALANSVGQKKSKMNLKFVDNRLETKSLNSLQRKTQSGTKTPGYMNFSIPQKRLSFLFEASLSSLMREKGQNGIYIMRILNWVIIMTQELILMDDQRKPLERSSEKK